MAALTGCVSTLACLLAAAPAAAAPQTIQVTNANDSGAGSLRAAVAAAAAGDTVSIQNGLHIKLSSAIAITQPITIAGGGPTTIVDAQSGSGVFTDTNTVGPVTFQDLQITGGSLTLPLGSTGGGGSAIADSGGKGLTLSGVLITGNTVNAPGILTATDTAGAVNENGGPLTITGSTVSNNTVTLSQPLLTLTAAGNGGAGIYQQSAASPGDVTITGSTFSGNTLNASGLTGGSTDNGGAAIYVAGGALTMTNTTVADNHVTVSAGATGGGAVYVAGTGASLTNVTIASNSSNKTAGGIITKAAAPVTLKSTLIAANGATSCAAIGGGAFASAGGNLENTTPSQCGLDSGTNSTDLIGVDPHIATLADYGGNVQTVALIAPSPAIDHISAAACTDQSTPTPQAVATDARGFARPQGSACDIGAYEAVPADLVLSGDASVPLTLAGQTDTLRYIVTNAGPGAAASTTLSVTLAPGLRYASAASFPSGTSCSGAGNGVSCTLGTIAPGARAAVVVTVAVTGAGAFTSSAITSSIVPDPAPANNAVNVTIGALPGPPVNVSRPTITGTALPGNTLSCAPGTWTNLATSFSYAWARNGRTIPGATSNSYAVQLLDATATLTCRVTAASPVAVSAASSSKGAVVAFPGTTSCPRPSGRLSATKLGPLALGETRTAARKRLRRYAHRGANIDDHCLYAGFGIRAGYMVSAPYARPTRANAAKAPIVLLMTSNPNFNLRGVTPGATLAVAHQRLKLGPVFHVGLDDWYFVRDDHAAPLLKVRFGIVQEIGIADRKSVRTRAAQSLFLTRFAAA